MPTFGGYYVERLQSLVQAIDCRGWQLQLIAIRDELRWYHSGDYRSRDALRYKGLLLVLRVLATQGWQGSGWRNDFIQPLPVDPTFQPIEIKPEEGVDLVAVKEVLNVVRDLECQPK